jgi:syntaxin 16
VLVIDQGTILDRIDFNMEQVVERTQEGLVQLNKVSRAA